MSVILHNKLIRDKVASIIKDSGKTANTRILSGTDFYNELCKKLQEEALEFQKSKSIEELADILEVIECLASTVGISFEQLLDIKKRKKIEKGGFELKVFLESVEDFKAGPEYMYKNVDSVVWLKYFNPFSKSPDIYEVIDFKRNPSLKVSARIISKDAKFVDITFQAMKDRTDGMKAIKENKDILKDFWGAHGDKKEYRFVITGLRC